MKLKYPTLHLAVEQQKLTVIVKDKVILLLWETLLYYQEKRKLIGICRMIFVEGFINERL